MKANRFCAVLIAAAGVLCVSALGRMEPPSLGDQPFLIGRPHPALIGIDGLRAVLLRSGADPSADGLDWRQFKADVTGRLNQANIKLIAGTTDTILSIPELRVYVNLLRLGDSRQYVFRIQTTVARPVCLKEQQDLVFKADLWTLRPAFEAVSAENMAARITDVVLEQVEAFVRAYRVANPPGGHPTDFKMGETGSAAVSQGQTETDTRSPTAGHSYIASKSSDIFHKSECRWAKNISPENLITYRSKEQAVKAGKRPCKWCKP